MSEGPWFLDTADLDALIEVLGREGREVLGPTVAQGAVVYDRIASAADLPVGWGDEQAPGKYRLEERGDSRVFGFAVGPTSWKRFTFPPRVTRLEATRGASGAVQYRPAESAVPAVAFLGVRACELAALRVQDRVFLGQPFRDDDYAARRAAAVVVATECTTCAATCFCASMDTGPEIGADTGADLVLTEVAGGFVVRAPTDTGRGIAAALPLADATSEHTAAAAAAVAAVREHQGVQVDAAVLADRLRSRPDDPRWAEVGERCLACTNCTMVCPTCFCYAAETVSDLDGVTASTERVWDSCFTEGFAAVAGGNFRSRVRDRYRHWLTHKFATWHDQFGTSGCVGCGRCITWCPVGIDVREELGALTTGTGHPPHDLVSADRTRRYPGTDADRDRFRPATVCDTRVETLDTTTIVIETDDPDILAGRPGQFVMVGLPAVGAPPISVSRYHTWAIELTVRAAGPATETLANLRPGDSLALRGPLGTPWPAEAAAGRPVVVATGGIGLAPLRSLVDAVLAQPARTQPLRLYHGARTPADLIFRGDLEAWAQHPGVEVGVTVDRAGAEWQGPVGVVTHLYDDAAWADPTTAAETVAFVCGPERMMQATASGLVGIGVRPENIWLTLERHMDCGVGLCGHCQVGPYFVCTDGPVFSLEALRGVLGVEGL